MSYEISLQDDQAILLVTITSDFNLGSDIPAINAELASILDSLSSPIHMIADLRDYKLDFASMVSGLAAGTRGSSMVVGHPNISSYVFVTASSVMRTGAKALSQPQYGGHPVTVVDTLDEALALVEA